MLVAPFERDLTLLPSGQVLVAGGEDDTGPWDDYVDDTIDSTLASAELYTR